MYVYRGVGGASISAGGGEPCPFSGQFSLTLNSHLWLQEAVECDSSHTPANRFGWRDRRGEGSRSGLKPSGETDGGYPPKHAKTGPGGQSRRERFSSISHEGGAQRARQGTTDVVTIHSTKGTARHYRRRDHPQHKGHGKALQTS